MQENTNVELVKKKKYIYYSEWSSWGRTSKDCNGWGLCDFWDCWFCEVGTEELTTSILSIDGGSSSATLTIELYPSTGEVVTAISEELDLVIDTDIVEEALPEEWTTMTLEAGSYSFDSSIGSYGGYVLPIVMN